jgi:hypothetical protein
MVGAPTTAPATATTTVTAHTTATAHLTRAESMTPDMAAPDPDEEAGTKTNTAAPGEQPWIHEAPLPSLPRPQGGQQTRKILISELQQYKDVIFSLKSFVKNLYKILWAEPSPIN